MFDRAKFKAVLRDSGLTKIEFAQVLDVTRQTIYDWSNGGEPSKPYLQRLVTRACDAILIAIRNGHLPLSRNLSKEERAKKVAIMASTVQAVPASQRL